MKKLFNFGSWHLWIGLVLSIPVIIVGVTAVFIAHKDQFKNTYIGSSSGEMKKYSTEIKSVIATSDGKMYAGTKDGLFLQDGNDWKEVKDLSGMDVKSLTVKGNILFAATKMGAYKVKGIEAEKIYSGEAHYISTSSDGMLWLTTKEKGIYESNDDGRNWNKNESFMSLNANVNKMQEGKSGMKFNKLIMDLHTGKFFLGKEYEWLWIDIVGLALALLTLTGILIWWKKLRNKRVIITNATTK